MLPLHVQDLCFEASGRRLLDGMCFQTTAQTRTIVLGPNGAGKSLLLRLCHGLLTPSAGTIAWGQVEMATARRYQAMVFQRPVLLRRSVAANLRYVLSLRGVPRRQRQALALEALEHAGLVAQAGQAARLLSGGEQQRLALVRAWVLKPQVVLLDEPTASLDPAATRGVETLLARLHASGTKIIMATHDLGQARRLADEVLFVHHGRLIEQTPAARFFTAPQSQEAAAFLEGKLLC
ncbi:MAG: ATP-binding cassette domain-containing protein [Candidatus Tectimicrobiota bacterium]